mgnify:CR=1 FL=1
MKKSLLTGLALVLGLSTLWASLSLPPIFQDGMVLQRGEGTRIRGHADSGSRVRLEFQGWQYSATASDDGEWTVEFGRLRPGGPFPMAIEAAGGGVIMYEQVFVGDVWICSGQSNMEIPMSRLRFKFPEEFSAPANSMIREFQVPDDYDFSGPVNEINGGSWREADPDSLMSFGAVGYFFGKYISAREGVPVGLVNSAVGGSPIESWMSEEALEAYPKDLAEAKSWNDPERIRNTTEREEARASEWQQKLEQADLGSREGKPALALPDENPGDWTPVRLPGNFSDSGLEAAPGVVWLSREFELEKDPGTLAARIWLGRIVDADEVFINGQLVGQTGYEYPPRVYDIPAGILNKGTNQLLVRVVVNNREGGFIPDKPYFLDTGRERVDLGGEWMARQFAIDETAPGRTFIRWKPMGLYNAMIAPLTGMSVKGIIWYQGESNAGRPGDYGSKFRTLIRDWRQHWYRGENLPFLFVQLPNFGDPTRDPGFVDGWSLLREAQESALELPATGMAAAYDVGEWNDIHPLDKKTVGYRLSLAARHVAYGEQDLLYSGPRYKGLERMGGALLVEFDSTGEGLRRFGESDTLGGFAVAGKDGVFHWARARIVERNAVIVWSEEVPEPVEVRYAWGMNPDRANLANSAGLPALPFRTDR